MYALKLRTRCAHNIKTRTRTLPTQTSPSACKRMKKSTNLSHTRVNKQNAKLLTEHNDESDNASTGSLDTLDSLQHFHQHQQSQQWPWNKYLPERYAFPNHDHHDHDAHNESSDDQCEFCGPPAPSNAAYLKEYHIHLPSLLE